jgi:hypothetical protein
MVKMLTVVEALSATGSYIPSLLILAGASLEEHFVQKSNLPAGVVAHILVFGCIKENNF